MIRAVYFDGRSARRHEVQLELAGDWLKIEGDGIERLVPRAAVHISERLGDAPRILRFADGAFCEVREHAGLEQALGQVGHRLRWAEQLERSWRIAVVSFAATVAIAVAAYIWLLPRAADLVARELSPALAVRITDSALAALDQHLMQPSLLSSERREHLRARFRLMLQAAGAEQAATPPRLEFRSSPAIGANAFALPDGRIVLLDQLVRLAANDDEILGVLAHEAGHVYYRHAMRNLLQGSFVAMVMTAWFGDVSSLMGALPTALLQARYSREFERQADDYAARSMRAGGLSPARLADLLERLAAQRDKAGGHSIAAGYLSSHPPTVERIRRLRNNRD